MVKFLHDPISLFKSLNFAEWSSWFVTYTHRNFHVCTWGVKSQTITILARVFDSNSFESIGFVNFTFTTIDRWKCCLFGCNCHVIYRLVLLIDYEQLMRYFVSCLFKSNIFLRISKSHFSNYRIGLILIWFTTSKWTISNITKVFKILDIQKKFSKLVVSQHYYYF